MVSPEALSVVEGRIIGRYALYGEIAAGGMATVHLGRLVGPVGFSRTVAIKRLHPQYAKDPEFVSMFLDEARLAARIQHPNVVSTLDVVALESEVFLVMEYVQGESLSKLVRTCRRRGELVSVRIASSVIAAALHGLHAAHEARSERGEPLHIVHRDVSPQNILVGVDGVARVLDFGVAKAAMRAQTTREGQMKGKLSYMAPEQLRAKSVDRRTDVFAAGVVLWEALAGRRLFDGVDTGEVLAKVLTGEILSPGQLVPSIPPALDAIVMRALERDPARRFATAREFAIALEDAGAVALNREVGEWVEEIGGDALARRAGQVSEIESISTIGSPFGAQAVALAAHQQSLAGPEPVRESSSSGVSTVSGAAQVGPAASYPSLLSLSGSPPGARRDGTSPSEVINLSLASAPDLVLAPRRRQGLYAALLGIAVALGIALVVLLVALFRNGAAVSPDVGAVRSAPAASVPATTVFPLASAGGALAGAGGAAVVESAGTTEPAPPPAPPHRSVASKAPPRQSHRVPGKSARKPKSAPKHNCNPPYTIDAKGIQRIKPQCL